MKGVRWSAAVLLVLGCVVPGLARKERTPVANVNFVVLRDSDGKPVRNAAVVLHPVDEDGKQQRGGLELKTDPEGKANYDSVPYGKIRIQVLAPGFQTYGEDYDISQANMDITIKMKRPTKQYSIYEEHPEQKQSPEEEKKPQL
jgi:Carboxypeptidase regulatory-like domain